MATKKKAEPTANKLIVVREQDGVSNTLLEQDLGGDSAVDVDLTDGTCTVTVKL